MENEQATVADVLEMLVGPPPDPEQHQEAQPTAEEEKAAFEKFFAGRQGTLKKHNPGRDRAALRLLAHAEWPKLTEGRRLHFVRKVRGVPGVVGASERTISAGQPVPPALWGRHKGSELLLAERGLLPTRPLRGACTSEAEHGQVSCMPCSGAPRPGLLWGRGRLFCRRVTSHAKNSCCCKHMLAAQPDFREEASALQHQIEQRVSVSRGEKTMQEPSTHTC